MAKVFRLGPAARRHLETGVDVLASAVKVTLGLRAAMSCWRN